MSSGRLRLRKVGFWIGALLILLLVANYVAFFIHQRAFPTSDAWSQLWAYLQSDAFKVITVSLVFPILAFLIESRFKIAERFRAERREKRWEVVEKTSEMWNELYDLTSEVRFFKPTTTENGRIEEILQRLATFPSRNEDVVNSWRFWFPKLSRESAQSMVDFFNILESSAHAVAFHIQQSAGARPLPQETQELQQYLGAIQTGVRRLSHNAIIDTLRISLDLEDGESGNGETGISEIKNDLMILKRNAELIKTEIRGRHMILPDLEGAEVEAFRKIGKRFLSTLRKEGGKRLSDYDEFKMLTESFPRIPNRHLAVGRELQYSKAVLQAVADWLGSVIVAIDISEMAEWAENSE